MPQLSRVARVAARGVTWARGLGSQELGLAAGVDDVGRTRPPGGEMGGELAGRHPHPDRQAGAFVGGVHQGVAELLLGGIPGIVALEPVGVEEGEPFAAVLDPRREALGDVKQRLLGGEFAFGVPRPGDQFGQPGAGLGEGEPRPDARSAGQTGGGGDPRLGALAGEDGERFLAQLGLAAQARREREERYLEAGDPAGHAVSPPSSDGASQRIAPTAGFLAAPGLAREIGGEAQGDRLGVALPAPGASTLDHLEAGGGPAQERYPLTTIPAAARGARFEHCLGGGAAHPVGTGDEQRGAVGAGRARQAQPRGLDPAAAGHRRHSEVDHQQRDAALQDCLGARHHLLEPPRPRPQESLEIDSRRGRRARIEAVAEVDEGGGFAAGGGGGERRQDEREAAARAAADELDHRSSLDAAGEQPVEGRARCRELLLLRTSPALFRKLAPGTELAGEVGGKDVLWKHISSEHYE